VHLPIQPAGLVIIAITETPDKVLVGLVVSKSLNLIRCSEVIEL